MSNLQEAAYPDEFDYTAGSPHLKHARLRRRIDQSLLDEVAKITARSGRCRALEIGAGHGSFTAVLRRAGAEVTVTEMSGPSAAHLQRIFGADAGVRVVYDADGTWLDRADESFDLVVMISVLHHIPDYLATVSRCADLTEPRGAFVSWQDPMWYPRQRRSALLLAKGAYFAWRLGQGNLARGFRTRLRRLRGVLDENEVSDMSEYHVVRQGVDETALLSLLRPRYASIDVVTYWSTQSVILQKAGDRLGMSGTFALLGHDRLIDGDAASAEMPEINVARS